jgi:AsmA protein
LQDSNKGADMHRGPPDLSQIRPSAELDPPQRPGRPPGKRRPRRRPPPAARTRRRRGSWLGRIGVGLGVIFALFAVAAGAFFYVVSPTELVRNELIRQVKANTGRTLTINGGSRFLLYPSIGVSLGDVRLSEPPAMGGAAMLEAQRIDVSVALMPLLSQEVHVEHIGLVSPVIRLRIDKKGLENWSFAGGTRPARYAALGASLAGAAGQTISDQTDGLVTKTAAPAQAGGLPSYIRQIELRSIALTKARIRYHDERSGALHDVKDLNLRVSGRRISDPLRAIGDLAWQGERISFDAHLDAPTKLLNQSAAKARVTINGAPLSAGFDGTVKLAPEFEARGAARFDGRSVGALIGWFGTRFANADLLGGFRGTGQLVAGSKSVALNDAQLVLGETRASGVIFAEMRKKRPYISTDLKITDLDIDKVSAAFAEAEPIAATSRPQGAGAGDEGKAPPQSIEDLLKRSALPPQMPGVAKFSPQVRGYQRREGWSEAPIDPATLAVVDAKARLKVDRLKVSGVAIERTALRAALSDGALELTIDELRLYGGAGKGVITAGAASNGFTVGTDLEIDKVAIHPLLKDAADFEMLSGQGRIKLAVRGAGASQRAIAQSLKGSADVTFSNGAIVGWNLAKILRGLSKGQLTELEAVETETTDFSELAAAFKIDGGNAVTDDLRMLSPLLRVAGNGRVGIGKRDLDLALKPKLVSSLAGQGGQRDVAGLEVPVRLKGAWRAPKVIPDVSGLARDPSQLVDTARELGRQIKGGNLGDIVRGVLGNGGGGGKPADNADQTGGGGTQDLIKRFLR